MTGKFKTYKNVAREAVRGRRAYYMGLGKNFLRK